MKKFVKIEAENKEEMVQAIAYVYSQRRFRLEDCPLFSEEELMQKMADVYGDEMKEDYELFRNSFFLKEPYPQIYLWKEGTAIKGYFMRTTPVTGISNADQFPDEEKEMTEAIERILEVRPV